MLTVINAVDSLPDYFGDGRFSIERWDKYIDAALPRHKRIFVRDMRETLRAGGITFEGSYLPVLNEALTNRDARARVVSAFRQVTENLDRKVSDVMGKPIDATILLYLGLCNGAGWVVELDSRPYVLLGIEKIIELGWWRVDDMIGLIYHELGHIYQMQYGTLTRSLQGGDAFLWQLFTEGIAMRFEQMLLGNPAYFHQDKNGWAAWCEANLRGISEDFQADLSHMTRQNQRYFGDWVRYKGQPDVGYYLGARFVQWLSERRRFDDLLNADMDFVRSEWLAYLRRYQQNK